MTTYRERTFGHGPGGGGRGGPPPGPRPPAGAGARPGDGRGPGPGTSGGPALSEEDKHAVQRVVEEDAPEDLVRLAEQHGRELAKRQLSYAQIRGVFSAVRDIELRWIEEAGRADARRDLLLLKPKLAYQAARTRRRRNDPGPVDYLAEVLNPGLDAVGNDPAKFRRFVDFFEAVLAYHRYHGGPEEETRR